MIESENKSPVSEASSKPRSSAINLSLISSLGIAVIIHAVIALAVGSYVVFEGIVPVPFFTSEGIDVSTAVVEDMPTLIEDEPLPQIQSESVQTIQEEAGGSDAPDMSDLITVSNSTLAPTFSMPTTAGNPGIISGNLFGSSGSGSGSGVGKGKVKLGSIFGSKSLGGGALTGHLYDFKQNPDRTLTDVGTGYAADKDSNVRSQLFMNDLKVFLKNWDESILKKYYQAKEPLVTTQVLMPGSTAAGAPAAFGVEAEVNPSGWAILYKGNITPPNSGMYRFVGKADDHIVVRVDGKVVFDGHHARNPLYPDARVERINNDFGTDWSGQWFRLRTGETYPIEILLCEVPGGSFYARLFIQEKGVNYETSPDGALILPPFQMMPTEVPAYFQGKVMEDGPVFGAN